MKQLVTKWIISEWIAIFNPMEYVLEKYEHKEKCSNQGCNS